MYHLAKFTLPKRRFWKAEQKMKSRFSIDCSMIRRPNRVLTPLKNASNIRMSSFVTHSKSQTVGQTKILEGETTDEMRISNEALFKCVSTQFGPGAIEKCFLRKSGVHHLFLLPKSSFGEHKVEACDCAELDVTSDKFRLDWSNCCGTTCSPFTRMRCHRDR